MTIAINTLVRTLGDFPLDPQAGLAWLWAADGQRILWASPAAAAKFGQGPEDRPLEIDHRGTLRGLIADLSMESPDQQPVRVQQVELINSKHRDIYTCLARAVPMLEGGFGMLVVAVGAPARSLDVIKAALSDNSQPELQPETLPKAVPAVAIPNIPVAVDSDRYQAQSSAPVWTKEQNASRRPLRFVWQTDEDGRFVHISRELSEAVGPSLAMLMNRTWQDIVGHYGVLESDDIQRGFESRDTWTAKPALWPVAGSDLGVPVEMAGMLVREDNRFAGFRGYGIARIERAIVRPGTAKEALIADTTPLSESDEDKFGPAVQRALASEIKTISEAKFAGEAKPASDTTPVLAKESAEPALPASLDNTASEKPALSTVGQSPRTPASEHPFIDRPTQPIDMQMRRPLSFTIGSYAATAPDVSADAHDKQAMDKQKPVAVSSTNAVQPTSDVQQQGNSAIRQPGPFPADEGKNLTEQERHAFREIARALGNTRQDIRQETHEDDTGTLKTSAEPSQVRTVRKPLEPQENLESQTAADERSAISPSGTISNDLFDEKTAPEPAKPVISFEAAQTLRNLRKQTPHAQGDLTTVLERLPIGMLVMQNGQSLLANRMLLDMLGYADFEAFLASGGAEKLFGAHAPSADSDARTYAILDSKGEAVQVRATIQAIVWNSQPATLTSFLPAPAIRVKTVNESAELDMLAAKAELRELKFVLDTATDGIISLDSNGHILGMNRSAEALFGFDQNEVTGESITSLLAPESHVAALDYLEGLKSNGVASIMNDGRDIIGRERHGGAIPLFMTLGRLGDNAKAQRFCAVLRDITSWKKAEADLREAKRLAEDSSANKTDFLARISHEVRTPLNAIIGFSQVMMMESFGPIGDRKYAQYAKDIHASGQHVLSLVNDLLDLSKISAGKMELAFASVDIRSVVSDCIAMIQPQANTGKIIVRSQLSGRLPPVVADERSLRQIVLNLLSNAIKFTEPGGQVIVSATFNDGGEVVVRVRDTGIGMSDDEIKLAMEPFRQIASPLSTGGTGLGLPLTKALVEANRASFSLSSETGKGTLVEVIFPSTRVLAE